ncbi:hypothetical protein TRFO_35103 [Tritrichomonas foetus]|uniref:Uncharacterized protein n=1 Tax=Tritrichomonas foetus TaxID=1144522 RepID=A0A1J4JMJ8_9EUKA|nr:hypothetical protein TRFO_35103 [Tritrichomonas foetus]|eukprot:OHS98476.1 hypothetical protein TRFO_35103 [Tritrichomonas foetus]
MKAQSRIAYKITDFNTNDHFKLRRITHDSDFTIYVKEIGLELFNSTMKMKISDKFDKFEGHVDENEASLTVSPNALSPYISLHFCPSKQLLPAIIGHLNCNLTGSISAIYNMKYFIGRPLPSVDAQFDYSHDIFGSTFKANLKPMHKLFDKYDTEFYGDFHISHNNRKYMLSADIDKNSIICYGIHYSSNKTYLGLSADKNFQMWLNFHKEISIKDTVFGLRLNAKRDTNGDFSRNTSVGVRKPFDFGYINFAFKEPKILSAKAKLKLTEKCELCGTIRFSNFKFDTPHLGFSVCLFPEDYDENKIKNLNKMNRSGPFIRV